MRASTEHGLPSAAAAAEPTSDPAQAQTLDHIPSPNRATPSAPIPDPRPTPQTQFGHYELLEVLGAGGMGTVYRAHDRRLEREVALKFLGAGPGGPQRFGALALRRFQREARAQSRIDHPGVCKVFEVGEFAGTPFIAMQLVRGVPLSTLSAQLNTEQKAALVSEAALAIQAAHRQGVIHRDLKPGNILIEQLDDGQLRPVIVDFGLARSSDESDLTQTGGFMGTPAFMSPEAVRGATIPDRRSDVYSLGAVLFSLLAGRPPHIGESPMEVLMAATEHDPPPLRSLVPSVSVDLAWITDRCLERNPDRRYDSARALSEDLQRFLNGEPVSRTGVTSFVGLRRFARRHRTLLRAASLAMVVIVASATYAAWHRLRAADDLAFTQTLIHDLEGLESRLRQIRSLPPHDITEERAAVLALVRAREAGLALVPERLRGPGLVAIGRIYLQLGNETAARTTIESAWALGYHVPAARVALGEALAEEYRARLSNLTGSGDAAYREAQRQRIDHAPLTRALTLLADDNEVQQEPLLERARIALYRGEHTAAIRLAEQAEQEAPWDPEPVAIAAAVQHERATAARDSGRFADAEVDFAAAAKRYQRAIDIARSHEQIRRQNARLWVDWYLLSSWRGNDDEALWSETSRAVEGLLLVTPRDLMALEVAAHFRQNAAERLSWAGRDPEKEAAQALPLLERLPPDVQPTAKLLDAVGSTLVSLVTHRLQAGGDVDTPLKRATALMQRATKNDPSYGWAWVNLGNCHRAEALWAEAQGRSSLPALQRTLDAIDKSEHRGTTAIITFGNRMEAAVLALRDINENGGDPTSYVANARRILAGLPPALRDHILIRDNEGWLELALAQRARLLGQPPGPALAAAETALRIAWQRAPYVADLRHLSSAIAAFRALLAVEDGSDPSVDLTEARRHLPQTDDSYQSLTTLCEVELLEARVSKGAQKHHALDRAEALAAQVLKRFHTRVPPQELLARVLLTRIRAGIGDPVGQRARALSMLDEILQVNPIRPRARALRGLLLGEKSDHGRAELAAAYSHNAQLRVEFTHLSEN